MLVIKVRSFGELPQGDRRSRIKALPNYKNGALENLVQTPMQLEGVGFTKLLLRFLFAKRPNASPKKALPHVVPNLNGLADPVSPEIIWFGHSSYLIKINGKRILVDPVFSNRASPVSFMGPKAFLGSDIVQAEEFKNIDILLITHDHFDHLDYETITKIWPHIDKVVTSLGVGAHLTDWGIAAEKITELAWNEHVLIDGLNFTAVSARHFSGRKFKRNQTVWSAFMLKTDTHHLFLGGDSGYEKHFKEIGDQFGPFDIALLECGQYNEYWPYIHMFPEQTVQAAKDLGTKTLMPVHWGKFSLAMHAWDEPIKKLFIEAKKQNLALTTPKIGETIVLDKPLPTEEWWIDN
ncbi:MBL fold metallo-hydrolase [Pedobacter sp. UYP30]|uniref:MBL fold metallo-hydrolase n=1 Tax=Pedobacter sp. UYP30 TaxID=1756400 RepID=UPI0033927408